MASAKVAVVTGANKGLGLALVQKLAAAGYRVFACARMASQAVHAPARFAPLLAVPGLVELIELDVSDEASRNAAALAIAARTDRIDLLINNAGVRRLNCACFSSCNAGHHWHAAVTCTHHFIQCDARVMCHCHRY
jgi:NAD(P)-dependent dehydrogenase (short-subunit alcohol dehydrogenase family)